MLAFTHKFQKCRRASVVPMMAFVILALLLLVGFALDLRRVQTTRASMQAAIDSAVLAASRAYTVSDEADDDKRLAEAKQVGEEYFRANMVRQSISQDALSLVIDLDAETGEMMGKVHGRLPLAFGDFIQKSDIGVGAMAAATIGDSRKLEIVLALDNSTSMFRQKRMTLLRDAAKNFTDTVFENAPSKNKVQIGVVPWSGSVNILSEAPKEWDDSAGSSDIVSMAGSQDEPGSPYSSRLSNLYRAWSYSGSYTSTELKNAFAPVGWRGCIAATDKERQVNGSGDVKVALTDAAPSPMKWPALLVGPEIHEQAVKTSYFASSSGVSGCKDYDYYDEGGVCGLVDYQMPQSSQCTSGNCKVMSCSQTDQQWGYDGLRNAYTPFDAPCSNSSNTIKTGTLTACVSDPNEHKWWDDDPTRTSCPNMSLASWTSMLPDDTAEPIAGPNMTCPSPILPMSGSRPQVIDKLNHIHPTPEGTHADVGLMWALRLLSPREDWTDFWGYTEDTLPGEWDSGRVRKVLVLLSDGKNESPNHFDGYYGCNEVTYSGYPDSGRAGLKDCQKASGMESIDPTALDNLMIDACDAVKGYDVELFTIALDLDETDKEQKKAIELLGKCATNSEMAFNITGGQLDEVFQQIANKSLRLSK